MIKISYLIIHDFLLRSKADNIIPFYRYRFKDGQIALKVKMQKIRHMRKYHIVKYLLVPMFAHFSDITN